jgi:phosphoglycerate dehydrogenase-like enzyme
VTTAFFAFNARPELRAYLAAGLADRSDIQLRFADSDEADALLALAPEAEIMIGWRPTSALLDAAPRLRLFINPGVGVQHLLPLFRQRAAARGAPESPESPLLANGHGNTGFVAQHGLALLLALSNRIVPHHNWMAEGQWRKGEADGASIPLAGRRVGLLGYGAINQKIHRLLSGFDLEVAALKRNWQNSEPSADPPFLRYRSSDLDDFLDWADVLIIAVPQTEETTGLIGAGQLERLGPKGLLINLARGPVVDEDALFEALQEQRIAGAAIDVWYDYRPEPDPEGRRYPYRRPFHHLDNVLLSPHRAASPLDDLPRWNEVIENIRRVADGRSDLLNLVDLDRGY